MPEEDKNVPKIDKDALKEKVKQNPKSRRWNNENSRKNLRQYRKNEPETFMPEIVSELDEEPSALDAAEIVRGRKLSPDLVKKLIPKRGTFTLAERKRFIGIVTQYLTDFKNEEPTASDCDDIFEIAKSDILEMRILQATRDDPAALLASNQFLEKIYKRKQTAKENLSARRSDRKNSNIGQGINIVDIVVNYDLTQKKLYENRVDALLEEEDRTEKELQDVIQEEQF